MASLLNGSRFSGFYDCQSVAKKQKTSWPNVYFHQRLSKDFMKKCSMSSTAKFDWSFMPRREGGKLLTKNRGTNVLSPEIMAPSFAPEFLDASEDEYDGVIIDPEILPSSANAFVSALRASLSYWKSQVSHHPRRVLHVVVDPKPNLFLFVGHSNTYCDRDGNGLLFCGKKGVWLKILPEQADLVPIAIQEGFSYHQAEPGYLMLTYWIPDEPCVLPGSPSHQIGVGGFVINDKREVLVVKEKRPCSCFGVWKFPTGYINKSEDIFSAAIREVKEETGVDTIFQEMVAFRHVHLAAFENSDILFMCMLKPLSSEITIDEKEIQAAKWMPLDEFVGQPFYVDDHMSRKVIDLCVKAYEERYNGFVARQLTSKLDGKISCLYYSD